MRFPCCWDSRARSSARYRIDGRLRLRRAIPCRSRSPSADGRFSSGVGDWESVRLLRDLWHFHFYGEVPLKLVAGRERIYFEHFWNDFAADPTHSVPEADRKFYAAAHARPGARRAGFEVVFRAFAQDAKDFAQFAQVKLMMPMLVLTTISGADPGRHPSDQ